MKCVANALTADPSDDDVRETIATIFSITKTGVNYFPYVRDMNIKRFQNLLENSVDETRLRVTLNRWAYCSRQTALVRTV
jgi:hypothetical protein